MYDCLVSSPAWEGAKFTGGVGAGGQKRDGGWGREEIGGNFFTSPISSHPHPVSFLHTRPHPTREFRAFPHGTGDKTIVSPWVLGRFGLGWAPCACPCTTSSNNNNNNNNNNNHLFVAVTNIMATKVQNTTQLYPFLGVSMLHMLHVLYGDL